MRFVFWILLIAGVAWAAATDQGRRAVMTVAAKVGVVPPVMELDVRALRGSMTRSEFQPAYGGVALECQPVPPGGPGQVGCFARISRLGDVPAYQIVFFFTDERLSGMRLSLQASAREEFRRWKEAVTHGAAPTLSDMTGQGDHFQTSTGAIRLERFKLPDGVLLTTDTPSQLDELMVVWMPSPGA